MSDLTQSEADRLRLLPKRRLDDTSRVYPHNGGKLSIDLLSTDGREQFHLDIERSRVVLNKGSYKNRGRRTIILSRLCFGGKPHTNPDLSRVGSPHLHLYREGSDDKWAYDLRTIGFPQLVNPWKGLNDFLDYSNVVLPPIIQSRL